MKTIVLLVLALSAAGCATTTRALKPCPLAPDQAEEVAWRTFQHPNCGDVWITNGGSNPQLPRVQFPITEESVLRENFDCRNDYQRERDEAEGKPPLVFNVNFDTERLELVDVGINGSIAWVNIVDGKLVVRVNHSTYCGGITPELTAAIIVVPKDAPPLEETRCQRGSPCTGPPRV